MDKEVDLLDILLSAASEQSTQANQNALKEIDIFNPEAEEKSSNRTKTSSAENDLYFEDEEENTNVMFSAYRKFSYQPKQKSQSQTWKAKPKLAPSTSLISSTPAENVDVYTDPFFGVRIINPLISSSTLQDRMAGREAVTISKLNRFIQMNGKEKDWVIAGVLVNKSTVKTTQKGKQYSIWTLTDLKDDIKTIALFLFNSAHAELWKTSVGVVVGILNPNILDSKDGSKDEASLSIDTPQKVMIFGQSKDFGTCKSVKKNGDKCNAIVNKNRCEYCVYHIKQEYRKCSLRSELQSNYVGRGLTALRNKVLGKNEVFYAGKSYSAIPAKKSGKLERKDNDRLNILNGNTNEVYVNYADKMKIKNKSVTKKKKNAARLDVSLAQRLRDIELLKKLGGGIESKTNFSAEHSTSITLEESKTKAIETINKLKQTKSNLPSKPNIQYDRCSDLLVDIENKKLFSGKLSASVSTEDSKTIAVSITSRLKSKNSRINIVDDQFDAAKPSELEEIFSNDDLTLEYDDEPPNCGTSKQVGVTPKKNEISFENKNINPYHSKNPAYIQSPKTHQIKERNSSNLNRSISNLAISNIPRLSSDSANSFIDLSLPFVKKTANRSKQTAVDLIKKIGPIKKENPNSLRGTGKKRSIPETECMESAAKKSKLAESEFISDRFKKMMAATSRHTDLIEARDDEEKEKYFTKLEAKEKMEEKMTSTYKVPCKAVRCLKCKYKSFSASDLCKTEKHPLAVFDAMKRFFKCGHCGNRTASLDIIPTRPCNNCGSGKWERTGMMKEKIVRVTDTLSIRGGEEKFLNSVATDTNVNLLVPEND